jgi:hypothetical protein
VSRTLKTSPFSCDTLTTPGSSAGASIVAFGSISACACVHVDNGPLDHVSFI